MPTTHPTTVYLLGCPAEVETPGGQWVACSLIGLFDVAEYMPTEPSNYVWSPTYLMTPTDPIEHHDVFKRWADEPLYYCVDAAAFDEQVRPKQWARMLDDERDAEIASEYEAAHEC